MKTMEVPQAARTRPARKHYKDLTIDPVRQMIFRRGKAVALTHIEYALFETLLAHEGRVCTRDALLRDVWGITAPIQTRTVDVFISRLRQKLHLEQELRTITRQGYLLEPPAALAAGRPE